jgi:hypothetical protein
MVRRWSYLNILNHQQLVTPSTSYLSLLPEYRLSLFKATTYYGTTLFTEAITKLNRRSFFRIRHITNLLIYQNLLINWAREYLWLRKVTRTILAVRLYKYNYLINLSTTAFNRSEKTFIKLHPYVLAGLSKFFIRFGVKVNAQFFALFQTVPHFTAMLLSTPDARVVGGKRGKSSNEFIYMTDGLTLTPPHNSTTVPHTLWTQILLQLQLTYLTEVYRLFTLAVLVSLSSHNFVFA